MAKKRDHRSAPSSGRRENRVKPSSRTDSDSASAGGSKVVALLIASSVIAVVAAYSYRLRQSSPPSQHKESYVYQRGLVTTDANYQDILTVSTAKTTLSMMIENSSFDYLFLTLWVYKWIRRIRKYQKIHLSAIILILCLATLLPGMRLLFYFIF